MSWTVDGREYHNWNRYQEALRRQQQRRAEERARRAQQEATRLRSRLRNQQRQLDEAQDNFREQQRINAQIDQTVRSMRRNQEQLEQAQQNLSTELQDVRETHREHVEAIERQFEEVQQELSSEIQREAQRAEQAREQLETKLTEQIESVRDRIDAKERNDREIAQLAIAEARALLERERAILSKMDLTHELETLQDKMNSLESSIQQNLPGVGVTGNQIQVDSNRLINNAYRIQAKMLAHQESALYRINRCKEDLDNKLVDDFYEVEKEQFLHRIQQVEESVREGYTNPNRMEIEAVEHEKLLARAEDIVLDIVCQKEITQNQHNDRRKALRERIPFLRANFGSHIEDPQVQFENPRDKKSPIILTYKTHDRTIEYRANLDGTFSMDGYGYSSNTACQNNGRQAVQALEEGSIVERQNIEGSGNRAQPRQALQEEQTSNIQENLQQFTRGQTS